MGKNTLSKKDYVQMFLKLYDESDWIYKTALPDFEQLKKKNPAEYTEQILILNEGGYSHENMRKRLQKMLEKEDGLIIKELYEEAVMAQKMSEMEPWQDTKVRITVVDDSKAALLGRPFIKKSRSFSKNPET